MYPHVRFSSSHVSCRDCSACSRPRAQSSATHVMEAYFSARTLERGGGAHSRYCFRMPLLRLCWDKPNACAGVPSSLLRHATQRMTKHSPEAICSNASSVAHRQRHTEAWCLVLHMDKCKLGPLEGCGPVLLCGQCRDTTGRLWSCTCVWTMSGHNRPRKWQER